MPVTLKNKKFIPCTQLGMLHTFINQSSFSVEKYSVNGLKKY